MTRRCETPVQQKTQYLDILAASALELWRIPEVWQSSPLQF